MLKKVLVVAAISATLSSVSFANTNNDVFPSHADESTSQLPPLTTFMDQHRFDPERMGMHIPSSGEYVTPLPRTTRADRFAGQKQVGASISDVIPKQDSRD